MTLPPSSRQAGTSLSNGNMGIATSALLARVASPSLLRRSKGCPNALPGCSCTFVGCSR